MATTPPPLVQVCWTASDWAFAIAALPVEGPLPARTVLISRERVAHGLRRACVDAGHAKTLAGTRFLTIAAAAAGVLEAANQTFTADEDAFRPSRLLALFRAGVDIEHFSLELLRSKPGWDEAFTRTIDDLEEAGLRPADLENETADPRLRDIARIWRAADVSADRSWSRARVVLEAAVALQAHPDRWPFGGPTLACVTGELTAAEARFLRAIPNVHVAILVARPVRMDHIARLKMLLGHEVADAVAGTNAPRTIGSERNILASYLFEPPAVLAEAGRPRSSGPDGTVDLEEHAGVDAEIESTADWVARQVLDGVPLQDIAILLPTLDPLAELVAARLERIPWGGGQLPVHVAGGLPITTTAGGARALAVVRALCDHLSGEALTDVLPALRMRGTDSQHLTHGAAMDLVWSLGTAGGNPANPGAALEWAARTGAREPALVAQLERAQSAQGDPAQAGLAREARHLERILDDLRAARPAIVALVEVARLVVDQRSLADLWPALRTFFADWLLEPGDGARVHALLDDEVGGTAADRACGALRGADALRVIENAIGSVCVTVGRYGEPAVYVGTIAGAVGLRFHAVRVIGLAEGSVPPLPREDPVIPDAVRARITAPAVGPTVSTGADGALAAVHALAITIRDARRTVALSAPRLDLERSQREGSSVLLEAAAALARPNAATGEPARTIPGTNAMRRDAYLPARQRAMDFRRTWPLGDAAWQDSVAEGQISIPSSWRGADALDLERILDLTRADATAGPLDGFLGPDATDVAIPGITREWPISPTNLRTLLQCPHLFLLNTLLRLDEPADAPSRREIQQPSYGGLFHRVAEAFYREHGSAFCARQRSLEAWRRSADHVVDREFELFLQEYPLVGAAVRRHQLERLRQDVYDLLGEEWEHGPSIRFVAVERPFGYPTPVEVSLGRRTLYVHGKIDRIDASNTHTVIRDLKTGRAHPRVGDEADPDPDLDIQLAVYGIVGSQLARTWGLPSRISAAYSYVGRGPGERDWRADFHQALEPAARAWLALATDLLEERSFPRTPIGDDCKYCAFRPVCGDRAREHAVQLLAGAKGTLGRFAAMKGLDTPKSSR